MRPVITPLPFEGGGRWPLPSPGQAPPAVIKAGPSATSGSASGASAYGPTTYYGAPDEAAQAQAAAKPAFPVLPVGLLLWALFGT
jgi:hypothetical protein